jgi:hypothetical protein
MGSWVVRSTPTEVVAGTSGVPLCMPFQPYWLHETDWLGTLVYLPYDPPEERTTGAHLIGILMGFATLTDTRVLARVWDPEAHLFELLFSFSSETLKKNFLQFITLNPGLIPCEVRDFRIPGVSEIESARPLGTVFSKDVLEVADTISTAVLMGLEDEIKLN